MYAAKPYLKENFYITLKFYLVQALDIAPYRNLYLFGRNAAITFKDT